MAQPATDLLGTLINGWVQVEAVKRQNEIPVAVATTRAPDVVEIKQNPNPGSKPGEAPMNGMSTLGLVGLGVIVAAAVFFIWRG